MLSYYRIEEQTGFIRVNTELDYETIREYTLRVQVKLFLNFILYFVFTIWELEICDTNVIFFPCHSKNSGENF